MPDFVRSKSQSTDVPLVTAWKSQLALKLMLAPAITDTLEAGAAMLAVGGFEAVTVTWSVPVPMESVQARVAAKLPSLLYTTLGFAWLESAIPEPLPKLQPKLLVPPSPSKLQEPLKFTWLP